LKQRSKETAFVDMDGKDVKEEKKMTKSQEQALERVRALVESELLSDEYEIKIWEISDCKYFISLVVEYGLKNDEGTLASLIARDRAHLFIGKRGGIRYPVSKDGETIYRVFKGYSILQAVCDQR